MLRVQSYMYEKPKQSSFDSLVNDHASLVKRIAHHLMARLRASIETGTFRSLQTALTRDWNSET